jgi:hypothetical protein
MKHGAYYRLTSGFDAPVPALESWEEAAKGRVLCPACKEPFRGVGPIAVQLMNEIDAWDNFTVEGISGTGVMFAANEFLQKLGIDEIGQLFYFGKLLAPSGRVYDQYSTLVAREPKISIRGGTQSRFRYCDVCGVLLYAPFNKHYVLTQDTASRSLLGAHAGLLVAEKIFSNLSTENWPNLQISKVPALDRPLDGFGELPPYRATCQCENKHQNNTIQHET